MHGRGSTVARGLVTAVLGVCGLAEGQPHIAADERVSALRVIVPARVSARSGDFTLVGYQMAIEHHAVPTRDRAEWR